MSLRLVSIVFVSFFILNTAIYAQDSFFRLAYSENIINKSRNFKVLTENYGYKYKFRNYSFDITFNLFKGKKLNLCSGLAYKKTYLQIVDRITHWNYVTTTFSTGVYYHDTTYQVYKDPADLISYSHNLGINNEVYFNFKPQRLVVHSIGAKSEIYLLEFFDTYYSTTGNTTVTPFTAFYEHKTKFFVSTINLSSFYRFTYKASDKFSLATKISLGTNLYSDWDQFKKYAWLGVGLELSFGNKPLFKKKNSSVE